MSLEQRFAEALPEVVIGVSPARFAAIAANQFTPKKPAEVRLDHLHAAQVSVREQIGLMRDRLRRSGALTFRALTDDCAHVLEVVARFLGLLEMYREKTVTFEQVQPLGDLHIRWTGTGTADPDGHDPDEDYE